MKDTPMATSELEITFLPSRTVVHARPGDALTTAAEQAGLTLTTPCGGSGTCGKCKVRIVEGEVPPTDTDRAALGPAAIQEGYRLACQTLAAGDVTVDIPAESLAEKPHKILTSGDNRETVLRPAVRKVFFETRPPDRDCPESDLARLRAAIGDCSVPAEVLASLPRFLRDNQWRGTAVVSHNTLIALEKDDTADKLYGVAFDVGTTTIAASLVDLTTGIETATACCINPQCSFGDDVLSRIRCIREDVDMLSQLQKAVIAAMNRLLDQLTGKGSISRERIYEIVAAGNTTMQQILCGFDPSALGVLPFAPVFDTSQRLPAASAGLKAHPLAEMVVYGQIGGFVGGDTLACMVSCRIDRWERPVLLIDIGTNGEIVLARDSTILAASTAAGPAFEGARISQGMRGGHGAVEKVVIGDDVYCEVVGNTAPVGICGSGLIDAAAQLRHRGILDMRGRILGPEEVPAAASEAIRRRIVSEVEGQFAFMLASTDESGLDAPVLLRQADIRQLQLAFGAIRAGITILLKRAELAPEDLEAILLAGAFGSFISTSSALTIGLLPPVAPSKVRTVGNAALAGAGAALRSVDERAYAEELRKKTVHVDLSLDQQFSMEFGMAMMFPEIDTTLPEVDKPGNPA